MEKYAHTCVINELNALEKILVILDLADKRPNVEKAKRLVSMLEKQCRASASKEKELFKELFKTVLHQKNI